MIVFMCQTLFLQLSNFCLLVNLNSLDLEKKKSDSSNFVLMIKQQTIVNP